LKRELVYLVNLSEQKSRCGVLDFREIFRIDKGATYG
jgi:hypothetical protein